MKCFTTILGARGSVPVSGMPYSRYGGATTCVLLNFGGQFIILDAGTGILSLPESAMRQPRLPLLLTHPHADHILGLPMCPYVMKREAQLDIYAVSRGGCDTREQICRLMSPPVWPVLPEMLPAKICFHDLPDTMRLGEVSIRVTEGNHPGGASVFRLEAEGCSVVFATDCTLTEDITPSLAAFAQDCDLLLCDGQYTDAEYAGFAGYGHSTWSMAAQLAQRCGAKQLRIVHHSPFRTDAELEFAAKALRAIDPAFDFAKEGEEIEL